MEFITGWRNSPSRESLCLTLRLGLSPRHTRKPRLLT